MDPESKGRRHRSHVATGSDARSVLKFLIEETGVSPVDAPYHLAQCLAFIIHDSSVSSLVEGLQLPKNKFALRKLHACLKTLDIIEGSDS